MLKSGDKTKSMMKKIFRGRRREGLKDEREECERQEERRLK